MKSQELLDNGVFTLQIISPEEAAEYRRNFLQAVTEESPEFWEDAPAYVVGGFGALGNPSSFHHPTFRNFRQTMFQKVLPIFRTYSKLYQKNPIWGPASKERYFVQCLMDRISFRQPGTSVAAESWHRDNSLSGLIKPGDQIFGMMLNLSEGPVNFSCVPGSHKTASAWHPGCFDKISPEEAEEESYNENKKNFSLRPGEMIVFFQHIVHEIARPKGKLKQPEFRVYTGVRLSLGETDFYPRDELETWIINQAVPRIKSGQIPDIYTKMHGVCFKNKPFHIAPGVRLSLDEWLERTFRFPEQISDRVHPSLASLKLRLHEKYQPKEAAILFPQPLFGQNKIKDKLKREK